MSESGPKTVLVVDDMGTIRAALAHHLKVAGYNALEAESGAAALQLVLREPPDLIILDVMMPKLDGFTVLDRLKKDQTTAMIPVILCTAKGFREDVLKANQLGASDYIVKPFTKVILLEKVRRLIGEPPAKPKPPRPAKVPAKPKEEGPEAEAAEPPAGEEPTAG